MVYEPVTAVEERTCGLLAGMLLARVDGKSPVEYITDAAEQDRVRQFAKAKLRVIPRSLVEIADEWRLYWS